MGTKMSADDIYSINKGFPQGRCGTFWWILHIGSNFARVYCSPIILWIYGEIQSHSSVEHNYIKNGFWAENLSEELSNQV